MRNLIRQPLGRVLIAAMVVFSSCASGSIVVGLDQLTIVRNNLPYFNDPFSDGIVPPSGPNGPSTYGVFGSIPNGSEAGGVLTLNSANGGLTQNATGQARRSITMTVNSGGGITNADTFTATALFNLVIPTGPLFETYSLRFVDGDGSVPIDDIVQLEVDYNQTLHEAVIDYIFQKISNGTSGTFGSVPLAPPLGADQIRLALTHPNTNNGSIFASYDFLQGGNVIGSGSFQTPGTMFVGENTLRAQILVAQGVPEPATLTLLGLGLAGLGFSRRKQ